MSVHYKFKAELGFSTVSFDGIHISVADLKEAIIDQKKLAKNADFDLQIMNAQNNEVYEGFTTLIPKNTSVTVARVPITEKRKTGGGYGGSAAQNRHRGPHQAPTSQPSAIAKGIDLASMDMSEEDKIDTMINQSTADFDPSNYQRTRSHGQYGRVPPSYRCHRCSLPGHWIKDCPSNGEPQIDLKKSTGIPRSFMVAVDGPQVPGALITPEGRYAVPAVDHAAYLEKNKPKPKLEAPPKPKIPEELLCNLCQDLLTDALLVPCCAVSYCDDCIRSALLESEEQECPGCHDKGITPNTLIPSRFLRTAVIAFKNETGYAKPPKVIEAPAPITVDLTDSAKKSPQRLSLDELPDDLFPHSPRKVDHDSQASKKEEPEADLYDFNDGSIPQIAIEPTVSREGSHIRASEMGMPGMQSHQGHGPPPPFQQYDRNMYRPGPRMPPYQTNMPPLRHQQNAPMHFQPMQSKPPMEREPPPPGFETTPPGEDKPMYRPVMEPNGGPPPNMRPMGGMPFDPNQPPPGSGFPQGLPPPGMGPYGGPPPTNAGYPYPPQFRGPPPGPQMYPGPPPRQGEPYYRDRVDRDRDRRRPEYDRDRERGRDSRERVRERDRRNDPSRPIDDPLEEFNRLMREKDRRKQIKAGAPVKRSRSPSFSPSRRMPSPFLKPPRSRERTFSRSPSPKRKRVLVTRRGSYSRSRSPPRRLIRVRSPSPLRRSPRRAPPYSPSPPPGFIRHPPQPRLFENDDYYDTRLRDRHEQPRTRPPPRERERERDREPLREADLRNDIRSERRPPKYDSSTVPSKYDRDRLHTEARSSEKDSRTRDRERTREKLDLVPATSEHTSDAHLKPPAGQYKISEDDRHTRHSHHRSSSRSRTESAQSKDNKDLSRDSKDKVGDSHHTKHATEEPETKPVDEKSPKKMKKEKKKHKKKSRDEKERKSKKKKGKGEGDTEEDHSVTSGSRRESSETQKDETEHPPQTDLGDKPDATTALCDSTVKSPVDGKSHVTSSSVVKELVFDPKYKASNERDVANTMAVVTSLVESTLAPGGSEGVALESKPLSPQIAIPPSKWDRDEEESNPEAAEKEKIDLPTPVQETTEPEKPGVKAVTSEVIKRAENAVFNKAIHAIRTDSKASESKSRHDEKKSPDRGRKRGEEVEVKRRYRGTADDLTIIVKNTELPEPKQPAARVPVRERLGSKVIDTDLHEKPALKSVVLPTKSSDQERGSAKPRSHSRERTQRSSSRTRHDSREQQRSRLNDLPRSRESRDDLSRPRRRTPEPRRSRSPLVLGPKLDRDRVRVDRDRSRRAEDDRDRSRRAEDDRDRGRDRDVRRQDDHRGRDRGGAQDRPRNDSRDRAARRSRERSPRRSRSLRRSRSPYRAGRQAERGREPQKLKSSVEIKDVFDRIQPSPPGAGRAGSQGILITRTNQEENWKLPDKFVPIGGPQLTAASQKSHEPTSSKAEALSAKRSESPTPQSANAKKQKGRINIKLSASSKAEDKASSSSSSDEEDDEDKGKSTDEEKKKKHKDKKKKAKRRRSNSSSSSSEEEEKSSKKKKKAKKKKKKSKKSKK